MLYILDKIRRNKLINILKEICIKTDIEECILISDITSKLYAVFYKEYSLYEIERTVLEYIDSTKVAYNETFVYNIKLLEIENKIISKLKTLIEITNNKKDYIIISDLALEIKDNTIDESEHVIKITIYRYLKENVKLNEMYRSKTIGSTNKRGYIGIRWLDETKRQSYNIKKLIIEEERNKRHYHLNTNYNLEELLKDKEKRKIFLKEMYVKIQNNDINWPPINVLFYNTVLIEDKLSEYINNINISQNSVNKIIPIISNPIVKKKEIILPKKESVLSPIKNTTTDKSFTEFLKENIILTNNPTNILYTEDIIKAYNNNLEMSDNNKLTKELRLFILREFCNNDLEKIVKFTHRLNSRRCYKNIILKTNV